jgi:hypothetical protein
MADPVDEDERLAGATAVMVEVHGAEAYAAGTASRRC